MSGWAVARRAVVLISIAFASIGPARANDAASAIADRFAVDADRAEVRRQQADKKREVQNRKDDARRQEARRKAVDGKRRAQAQAVEEARRAAEQAKSDEADMLARARREAEEMRAGDEHGRLAEEARRLIIEAERERAKAEALLERGRAAGEPTHAAAPPDSDALRREAAEVEARRTAQAAGERERLRAAEEEKLAQARREQTRRIIEKLHRMRQIREARLAAQARRTLAEPDTTPPSGRRAAPASRQRVEAADSETRGAPPTNGALTMAPPPIQPPRAEEARDPRQERSALGGDPLARRHAHRPTDTRFTVLLILAPGTYGIRRNGPKVADPILCTLDGCYVSEGADRQASFLPGRKALSFGNTWGARAGACRQRLGCVFRGIELGELPVYLQPVDLHILRHDRRRGQVIAGDSACGTDGGRLLCGRGVYADDYALWMVPEHVAEAAGPAALERAVADGLNGPRSADVSTRAGR